MAKISQLRGLVLSLCVCFPCTAVFAQVVTVKFSPHGGCTAEVVKCVASAKSNVLVQAYVLTSEPVVKSLIEAQKRNVRVLVLLDKSDKQQKVSLARLLSTNGVWVAVDSLHAIAHNKVIVIDFVTVLTGSFNFSEAAEKSNAENLCVIRDATVARQYADNWKLHAQHSNQWHK